MISSSGRSAPETGDLVEMGKTEGFSVTAFDTVTARGR
jgi:hypothetical protein